MKFFANYGENLCVLRRLENYLTAVERKEDAKGAKKKLVFSDIKFNY